MAGLNGDIRYSGKSQSLVAQASRVLHRSSAQNHVHGTWRAGQRKLHQRHGSGSSAPPRLLRKAGLQHRHYIGPATLDAGINYQRGTRWFGAQPAPEETFDEATALGRILRTNARLSLPFALSTQHLRYDVARQRQTSNTPLTSQDQFAIGGRWTVRGFDGERTLNADCGWLVRNDLSGRPRLPEPSSIWLPTTARSLATARST